MKENPKSTTILKTIVGLILLFLGFYLMSNVNLHIGYAQEFTLLVFSIAGVLIIFGKHVLTWFAKPQGKFLKVALACLVINAIWSMLGGALVNVIFGDAGSHANPAFGDFSLIFFIPFMLMGEELFSIGILETLRTKWGISTLVSTLITGAIFGLIHFNSYYGGDILRTIVQILMVQGVARLILNYAYLKTRSIWTSYAVHLIFDLIILFVLPLVLPK